MTDEGATDRARRLTATVPDIGLDRADKFVLGNLAAVAVPHADATADPSRTVRGRRDDARRRSLRLENRDSPLEPCLLLELVEEGRIVRVAPWGESPSRSAPIREQGPNEALARWRVAANGAMVTKS